MIFGLSLSFFFVIFKTLPWKFIPWQFKTLCLMENFQKNILENYSQRVLSFKCISSFPPEISRCSAVQSNETRRAGWVEISRVCISALGAHERWKILDSYRWNFAKSLTLILKSGEPEREGKKNLKRQRNRESMNKNLFRDIMYMSIHMVFSLHATRSESGEKNIVRSSSCNAKVVGWFAWRTNARAKTTSSAATKGVWWERMKRKKQAKQAYKIGGYDEIGFAGLLRACVCVLQIKSYIMKIPLTHHMQTHSHTMRTFMPIIQSVNWQI